MIYNLYNDHLQVGIKRKGAELCSLRPVNSDLEYIWQAEAAVWARHAPVLFPIVGKLRANKYYWLGNEYHLPQHGFARDMDFSCISHSTCKAEFELTHNEISRLNYPFDFKLKITYELAGNRLNISWHVINQGEEPMPFSIGAHPGFNIQVFENEQVDDYYLKFSSPETLDLFGLSDGLISGVKTPAFLNNISELQLTRNIFDADALVFRGHKSKSIALVNKQGNYNLTIGTEGFQYLGIWSKPGQPFVCIEPWHGIADTVEHDGDILTKEGVMILGAGKTFDSSYYISVE